MANKDTYWKSVFDKAFDQLAELRAERDNLDAQLEEINKEIVQWEQVVSAMTPLSTTDAKHQGEVRVEGLAELGLADAVRKVLQANSSHRTARGIRDSLGVSGYDLKQHNNALASIHGVLKRMVDSGEVEPVEVSGKTRYRWKPATFLLKASGHGSGRSAAIFQSATAEAAAAQVIGQVMKMRTNAEERAMRKAMEDAARLEKLTRGR